VTYTIAEPCIDVKDKACIEECPVDCIYEGARMLLYIHPRRVRRLRRVRAGCPTEAIYYQNDLPEQWNHDMRINADFFAELGSLGRASNVGMTENDPLAVKQGPAVGENA
jgi:NAD-dependent dihydropyrimidine dehydrogenase PreA subunit